MKLISDDTSTQVAFSVYENKGIYALLLGSGLSRAAGIQTGWEITLDLVRRVALAQGVTDQADWAAWYRERVGKVPDYSDLLEELALSPEDRRAILHSYIEPTDEDREAGKKLPTTAHKAIAQLVQQGYIKVIVTTNFDRLMENALRERGIEPTVVSSVDALSGAEPITHSTCYILKIHGDYKDARILNTTTELETYPPAYDTLLDRILDEYGLIICGWSGEWDHALRRAFLRTPNRRYSTFWATRGLLGSGATELATHRRARVLSIPDADSFFSTLQQHVETLEQTHRQNPIGIDLLVGSAKRFLAKPEYRIQLDELFTREAERVVGLLDGPEFSPNGPFDRAQFRLRIERYEALTEALACMSGALGRWGGGDEFSLCVDVIKLIIAHGKKIGSGLNFHLNIRDYPAVLIFTSYGLGLAKSGRLDILHKLFSVEINIEYKDPIRMIDALFLNNWDGGRNEIWHQLDGLDKRHTPLSDHLCELFSVWGKRFIGVDADRDLLFERFEMLGSLACFEVNGKADIQQALSPKSGRRGIFMPVGRSGWHQRTSKIIIAEMQHPDFRSRLIEGGFANKDPEIIDLFLQNFGSVAFSMRW